MTQKELIPPHLIPKIRKLENDLQQSPVTIANAVCASRWYDVWWDRHCFLNSSAKGLIERIYEADLNGYGKGSPSLNENYYWMHFLAPFAAYNRRSTLWEIALLAMSMDPGIKIGEVKKRIKPQFEYSFWYSIGGDRLQDFISGVIDEDEYKADILGLLVLEEFQTDQSLRLSQLLESARDKVYLVANGEFKNSHYYQVAEECLNPIFGDKIIRLLAKYMPFLCAKGIITAIIQKP